MLSGETANGKYPLEALKMMVKIAERTEQDIKGRSADIAKVHSKRSISSAVCNATVQTADNLNAKAIVCPTISGFTARLTSKLKPNAEIIGCSPYDNVLRKMQIYWGVRPLKTATETSTDKIIEHALVVSEQAGYVEEGDSRPVPRRSGSSFRFPCSQAAPVPRPAGPRSSYRSGRRCIFASRRRSPRRRCSPQGTPACACVRGMVQVSTFS